MPLSHANCASQVSTSLPSAATWCHFIPAGALRQTLHGSFFISMIKNSRHEVKQMIDFHQAIVV
jgi:hypothetical protein